MGKGGAVRIQLSQCEIALTLLLDWLRAFFVDLLRGQIVFCLALGCFLVLGAVASSGPDKGAVPFSGASRGLDFVRVVGIFCSLFLLTCLLV